MRNLIGCVAAERPFESRLIEAVRIVEETSGSNQLCITENLKKVRLKKRLLEELLDGLLSLDL